MLTSVLHSGSTHPDLLWVVVPSLLTFAAGLGLGAFSDRIRGWLQSQATAVRE